jgi:hypothetical protein
MKQLKEISPVEFCRKTGNEKAITQGHATRTKKRLLSKVFTVFELVDKLGFKISIEPKN